MHRQIWAAQILQRGDESPCLIRGTLVKTSPNWSTTSSRVVPVLSAKYSCSTCTKPIGESASSLLRRARSSVRWTRVRPSRTIRHAASRAGPNQPPRLTSMGTSPVPVSEDSPLLREPMRMVRRSLLRDEIRAVEEIEVSAVLRPEGWPALCRGCVGAKYRRARQAVKRAAWG